MEIRTRQTCASRRPVPRLMASASAGEQVIDDARALSEPGSIEDAISRCAKAREAWR